MPSETTKWITFDKHINQLKVSFVVYADTEVFLKNINNDEQQVFNKEFSTFAYQDHRMYNVGYYF